MHCLLLFACVAHGNVEVGVVAAEQFLKLEPKNTGNYIMLAKLYAEVERSRKCETHRVAQD